MNGIFDNRNTRLKIFIEKCPLAAKMEQELNKLAFKQKSNKDPDEYMSSYNKILLESNKFKATPGEVPKISEAFFP